MFMKAFIKSAVAISPQKTFGIKGFPTEVMDYAETGFLKCIEPLYRDFLDPMVSRRMSRIVKMSVCGALGCIQNAGIKMPDGIITGTGLGCIEDTEKFLGSIYTGEERLLNPTPFIQSTHNTVAGAIALAIKCHAYNATYAHRGFSFESAILDALLHVSENPDTHILAGSFDELTPNSYQITRRLGLWKTEPVSSLSLIKEGGTGTMPGEGLAFFMLTGKRDDNSMAQLRSMRTLYKPHSDEEIENVMTRFIEDAGLSSSDIDMAILGLNGDNVSDRIYRHLMKGVLNGIPVSCFKHLCGEYDTSSSFALWLASVIVQSRQVPDCIRLGDMIPEKMNQILIYNHLWGVNHSMYLLSSC